MRIATFVTLLLVTSFSSAASLSPEEKKQGLIRSFQQGGTEAGKEFFEQNKKWSGSSTSGKYVIHINEDEKDHSNLEDHNELDWNQIERKVKFDQSVATQVKEHCSSSKEDDLGKCRDIFYMEICKDNARKDCPIYADEIGDTGAVRYRAANPEAIFKKLWLQKVTIDEAQSLYVSGLDKLTKIYEGKVAAQSTVNKKLKEQLQRQEQLCKKNGRNFLVKAIVRVEENVGKGLLNTKLISVQNYLCGGLDSAQWLPKIFVMKGVSKPQQQHCASVIIGSAEKVKLPNKQGFQETWQVWQVVGKNEVDKEFYQQPNWNYCP